MENTSGTRAKKIININRLLRFISNKDIVCESVTLEQLLGDNELLFKIIGLGLLSKNEHVKQVCLVLQNDLELNKGDHSFLVSKEVIKKENLEISTIEKEKKEKLWNEIANLAKTIGGPIAGVLFIKKVKNDERDIRDIIRDFRGSLDDDFVKRALKIILANGG